VIDHERCSALLRDFAAGDLGEADARAVREHLGTCASCSSELIVVQMLVDSPEEHLTELESRRLRQGVASALESSAAEPLRYDSGGDVIPSRVSPWQARIAPLLGAAAVIALLLFAATQVTLGGSDDLATSGAPNMEAGGGDKAPRDTETRASDNDDHKGVSEGRSKAAAVTGDAIESADGAAAGPQPQFLPLGKVTARELEQLATSGAAFTSFAKSYSGANATVLQDEFLDRLALDAPAGSRDEIRTCGAQIFEQGSRYRYLPAYGGFATIKGTRALLLGFAYTLQEKRPLDRFQLWAWKRPGCEHVILYQKGPIGP
jgi:hypothetical protein